MQQEYSRNTAEQQEQQANLLPCLLFRRAAFHILLVDMPPSVFSFTSVSKRRTWSL
jgi:hypothetical protein